MKFKELRLGDNFKIGPTGIPLAKTESYCGINAVSLNQKSVFDYEVEEDREVIVIKPFKVATSWSMCWEGEVYAESLEDAIEKVEEDDGVLINTDRDGSYIDGSFEVNLEVTEELNKCDYCNGTGVSETELYEGVIDCPVCKTSKP